MVMMLDDDDSNEDDDSYLVSNGKYAVDAAFTPHGRRVNNVLLMAWRR